MIRVLVIDDHPVVLEGLTQLLDADPEIRVVGQTGSGETGLAAARQLKPDVAVVDVHLPGIDGYATCVELRAVPVGPAVVLTTSAPSAVALRRASVAGCAGLVSKAAPPRVFRDAVRCAANGKLFVDPALAHLTTVSVADVQLSDIDRELLALVSRGFTNAEIGSRIGLSAGTVRNRVSSLLRRLGARRRADLAFTAAHLGLSDCDERASDEASAPCPNFPEEIVTFDTSQLELEGARFATNRPSLPALQPVSGSGPRG